MISSEEPARKGLCGDLQETFEIISLYKLKLNPKKYVFQMAGKFLRFLIDWRVIEANPGKIQCSLKL